jgi:hypothetical protein
VGVDGERCGRMYVEVLDYGDGAVGLGVFCGCGWSENVEGVEASGGVVASVGEVVGMCADHRPGVRRVVVDEEPAVCESG